MSDPWNIGTLKKPGIWIFYFLSNYTGVILCAIMIMDVSRNKKRSISDIFVCGLASGCLTMSLTCGTQCLLNLIANRFYGGEIACQIEAIAHISSVLTEFFCVMALGICTYYRVVHQKTIEQVTALKIVILIWVTCTIFTLITSLFSPIYLMSAGTYCFFAFSSFAIAGWLVPGLIIALVTMFVAHIKIMRFFSNAIATQMYAPNHKNLITQQDIWIRQFQWRSTLFMIILLIGWGFAAVTVIYELVVGESSEWLVTAVGVGGVSFSWWVPLVFLYTSPQYKKSFICKKKLQRLSKSNVDYEIPHELINQVIHEAVNESTKESINLNMTIENK